MRFEIFRAPHPPSGMKLVTSKEPSEICLSKCWWQQFCVSGIWTQRFTFTLQFRLRRFAVHTNALLWFGDVWRRVNVFVFSVLSCRASRFQLQFRKSSCITVKSASAGSASTFHRFVERLQPRFVHDITTTVCVCAAPREEGVVHILHLHIDTSRNDASTASASCLSVALSCS